MQQFLQSKSWLAGLLCLFLLASCSSSENTVVIKSAPTSTANADSTQQIPVSNDNFRQLTIGENQPIRSLDPLFAENYSELRAIQLMYEGLVRYDKNGRIIPAGAKNWSVNNSNQTYRFTLRSDLYYQDSDLFTNGRGRKVITTDIKQDFERMAKANVPERAAHLFTNIRGFEPYFEEQHHVMLKSERQLSGINGIKTPNDSTIVFSLVRPDKNFLQRLATPYAVFYPQKSTTSNRFRAVGSGPFKLSQRRSDSVYIFARFDNYYHADKIDLNRVDIRSNGNESSLLKALNNDEIQLIPQLGPRQMQATINESGQLKQSFSPKFRLIHLNHSTIYVLRYNNSDVSKPAVVNALRKVENEHFFPDLSSNMMELDWSLPTVSSNEVADSLSTPFMSDPLSKQFIASLGQKLDNNGIHLSMSNIRVATRNTPLRFDHSLHLMGDSLPLGQNILARIKVSSVRLVNQHVSNIQFNAYPWWIDLRGVTVSSTNNQ